MQIGKVVGTVVSTLKDDKLDGLKLLVVQKTNHKGEPDGGVVVAIDSVGAGVGELVLTAAGSAARQTVVTEGKPVDTVIMAIVDLIEVGGDYTYKKDVVE